jgi:hypothetical protein
MHILNLYFILFQILFLCFCIVFYARYFIQHPFRKYCHNFSDAILLLVFALWYVVRVILVRSSFFVGNFQCVAYGK